MTDEQREQPMTTDAPLSPKCVVCGEAIERTAIQAFPTGWMHVRPGADHKGLPA